MIYDATSTSPLRNCCGFWQTTPPSILIFTIVEKSPSKIIVCCRQDVDGMAVMSRDCPHKSWSMVSVCRWGEGFFGLLWAYDFYIAFAFSRHGPFVIATRVPGCLFMYHLFHLVRKITSKVWRRMPNLGEWYFFIMINTSGLHNSRTKRLAW